MHSPQHTKSSDGYQNGGHSEEPDPDVEICVALYGFVRSQQSGYLGYEQKQHDHGDQPENKGQHNRQSGVFFRGFLVTGSNGSGHVGLGCDAQEVEYPEC